MPDEDEAWPYGTKTVVFKTMRIIMTITEIQGLSGTWWWFYDNQTERQWIRRYDG